MSTNVHVRVYETQKLCVLLTEPIKFPLFPISLVEAEVNIGINKIK